MDFVQEFNLKLGSKYPNLHIKNVVVSVKENLCTITFLYPSQDENLTDEQKEEIITFIKDKLKLEELKLKVKFMKVYVEEKLIRKMLFQLFEEKFKLLNTYVRDDDVKIKIGGIDVEIVVNVSPRIAEFFNNNKVSSYLCKELKNNFLVDFVITLNVCENKIDEVEIDNVVVKTSAKKTQRYDVLIIKDVIGSNIPPKPEYISYITGPKTSVIIAGYISGLTRKDFVIKKGARVGQQKAYYTFSICDGKGKIDCIYFCPKKHERDMDVLEENMFLLLHGDVRMGLNSKLVLYIDKLALASETEQLLQEEEDDVQTYKPVEIERLGALEQDNMFGEVDKYNAKIMNSNIVVFDVETTGLNPEIDQIIELGAVKIERGNIIEKFSTFIKPTIEIPYEVTELTHITNEMVEDAPPIEQVIKEFYDFSRDCVLCGHNIINFDIKFIRRFGRLQNLEFDNNLIDTMNEARVSRLKISRFNLGTVTKALGIELKGAHRAWNDAYATAQVLLKLNEVWFLLVSENVLLKWVVLILWNIFFIKK